MSGRGETRTYRRAKIRVRISAIIGHQTGEQRGRPGSIANEIVSTHWAAQVRPPARAPVIEKARLADMRPKTLRLSHRRKRRMPNNGTVHAKNVPGPYIAFMRLENLLVQKKVKLDWRHSIVDLMKLLNLDSSLAARKELAIELNYSGAKDGSAEMNIWLHKAVMKNLAENGGKVPESLKN